MPQRAGINPFFKMFLCGPKARQGGGGLPGKAAAHPGAGTALGGTTPIPDTTPQLLLHLPVSALSPLNQNLRLNYLLLFTSTK